jgi:hypothetical protein
MPEVSVKSRTVTSFSVADGAAGASAFFWQAVINTAKAAASTNKLALETILRINILLIK